MLGGFHTERVAFEEINEVVSKLRLFKMEIHIETNNLCCTFFKFSLNYARQLFQINSSLHVIAALNMCPIFYCRCTWKRSKDKPQAK